MADHAKPILTDNYTDVLSQIRGRFEDQAKGFDPANTTATNITTGTIRWNSAEKKFQKWSGTAWGDLTDNYVLSGATFSTGTANAVAYLNGSKVLTTGSALTFNGTVLATTGYFSFGSSGNLLYQSAASTVSMRVGLTPSYFAFKDVSGTPMLDGAGGAIAFGTAGSEQMRLTSTGLGIGTSSPAAKVHALTPSAAAVGFRAANSISFAEFQVDASGNSQLIAPGGTQIFNTDGSERMRLDASGNLLVGNINGTSRITASGVIESTTGGFKFPDGTTQTSAAVDPATVAAGAVGTYAMLVNDTTSGFNSGAVFTTSSYGQLTFAATSGRTGVFATVVPIGQTWMCMGLAEGTAVYPDAKDRTTLWFRVS